jgi:hypothetical protein
MEKPAPTQRYKRVTSAQAKGPKWMKTSFAFPRRRIQLHLDVDEHF